MTEALSASPLWKQVQFVKNIGPRRAAALAEIGIHHVLDLLYYLPRRYLDRSSVVTIADLHAHAPGPDLLPLEGGEQPVKREVTVVGVVRSHKVIGTGRSARFILILADPTGSLQCVWFGGVQYWRRAFTVGETLAISGKPTFYGNILQIVHPDVDRIQERGGEGELKVRSGILPLYSSSQALARVGLESAGFRRVIEGLLETSAAALHEFLPDEILSSRKLLPFRDAVHMAHFPESLEALDQARRRLKYDELFLFQLKLGLRRRMARESAGGISFNVKSPLARSLVDALPFSLTGAQIRVLREIAADMEAPRPMNRLLQGDVGSGKTIVALAAMLVVVDNGYQAVFMAPTEILAEQHFRTITQLLGNLPVNTRLLVGAQRSRLRQDILGELRDGRAQIVVGTHALLEKKVAFHHLGLVVIDEQHRFGVMQRATVREKGENPDVLVMTATPIPRTLSLTLYGDLDVSVIDEMPSGRRPITTWLRSENDKETVYSFVRKQIAAGRQAYFVYPLIEESDKLDLKAATHHFEQLQQEVFPGLRLGLIHGRLAADEKESLMRRFKSRELDILVATTVIEVGIDVPNATVMIIENAEHFGLSQLHQLRGRVGRGSEQSYCILLAPRWIERGAQRGLAAGKGVEDDQQRVVEKRLATMVETTDGFRIAEVDLQLRGPGDFFGTRQSGMPEFRAADLLTDTAILHDARADAVALVDADPFLRGAGHRRLADHLRSSFAEAMTLLKTG
jgi:ATP-dependent DNA helicase RecG